MTLYDEFESQSSGSGAPIAPADLKQPELYNAPAPPPVLDAHPNDIAAFVNDEEVQAAPYEKRMAGLNQLAQGVLQHIQKQPDTNDATMQSFAELYHAASQKLAPPEAPSAIGSFFAPIKEDIVPNALATGAGIGAGVLASETGPGAVVADVAAATATSAAAKGAQNALRGPVATTRAGETQALAQQAHPWAYGAGKLLVDLPTMLYGRNPFKKGSTVSKLGQRVVTSAGSGARMGGIVGGSQAASGQGLLSIPKNIAEQMVTMGALGLVGPAKTLLQAIGKVPTDAAIAATSHALYKAATEAAQGQSIDMVKLAKETGEEALASLPGFLVLGWLGHAVHSKEAKKLSSEAPASASSPETATVATAQTTDGGSMPPAGSGEPPTPQQIINRQHPDYANAQATYDANAVGYVSPAIVEHFGLDRSKDLPPATPPPVDSTTPAPSREPGLEGTSINHADTDRIRESMGLPPEDRSGRVLTNEEAEARANAIIGQDHTIPDKTYQFYLEHPEARINQVDEVIMFRVQQAQEANFNKLRADLAAMPKDAAGRTELEAKMQEAEDTLRTTLDMHSLAGSAWSAEGIARQRRAQERLNSFPQTLFTVEAKKGAPLTEVEKTTLEKAHKDFTEKKANTKRLEEITKQPDAEVAAGVEKAIKKTASKRTADIESFIDKQIEAAKKRLRGQGRLMATVDPLGLVDHAIIGAGYIAKGVVKLSAWSAKMIADFGESVRPHLDKIFAMSKAQLETWKKEVIANHATPESVKADWKGEPINELHSLAAELAKAHSYADPSLTGESPDHFKVLTERVQSDLKELGQDLTPSETARAITNYGKQPEPKVSPEQARLKELKAQILINEKLADAQDGQVPWIRRIFKKPSEEVRRMNTQLQDEVRKIENAEVAAGRMKTAQQRVVSALNNQIKDIDAELAGTAAKRANKPPIPDTPEITALRAHRDALQKALDEKRDPTGDIGYNDRATAAAKASEKFYKRKLAEGRYTTSAPPKRPTTPETVAARAAAKRAKDAFNSAAEKSGEPAEARLKAVVTRMNNRIAELQTQITTGNKLAGSNGQRYINKSDPRYRTSEAILKRLRDTLQSRRVQVARSARAAADALMRSMDAQITDMQRIITQRRRAGQASPQLETELAALKEQRAVLDAPTLERLKANEEAKQARYAKQEADMRASGKIPEKQAKRTPENPALEASRDATARAKAKLDETMLKIELAGRSRPRKIMDAFVSWSRIGKLSHILVLEKLVGAGIENIITNPISRALVQIGRLNPTARAILGKATYEGSIGLKAEGRSIMASIRSFRKDVWDKIRHGKSSIDYLYERGKNYPPEFLQVVGNIHGGIKEPIRQGIFARSLKYRMDAADRAGIDWQSDPLMQRKMHEAALVDANSDIFMGDNIITKALHHGVVSWLRNSKSTGAHIFADGLDVIFPIVNVPTNLAIRGFQMTTGLPEAMARMGKAAFEGKLKNHAETLTEAEAEKITKAAKYGIIGLLTGVYAWTHNQQFGGFYTQDKKDDNKEGLHYGDSKFGPVTVNHHLGHGPWLFHMNIIAQARRIFDRKVAKGENVYDAAVETAGAVMGQKAAQLPLVSTAKRMTQANQTVDKWTAGTVRDAIIPGIIQDAARSPMFDPQSGITRRPQNARQEFMLGIPWMRNQVPLSTTKH